MVIFNSYVKLPEGSSNDSCNDSCVIVMIPVNLRTYDTYKL